MVTIANDLIQVTITDSGSQILSIEDLASEHEFVWQGMEGQDYQSAQSLLLFPFNNLDDQLLYTHKGKEYVLSHSTFYTLMTSSLQHQSENSASFCLKSNDQTKKYFPFDFSLQVNYLVYNRGLTLSLEVLNASASENLYYACGFNLDFLFVHTRERKYPDFDKVYYHFEPAGHYYELYLTEEGAVDPSQSRYKKIEEQRLRHRHFKGSPIIYQLHEGAQHIIESQSDKSKIVFRPQGFDYISLWASYPERIPYLNFRTWTDLPNNFDDCSVLNLKKNLIHLGPRQMKSHDLTMEFHKNNK